MKDLKELLVKAIDDVIEENQCLDAGMIANAVLEVIGEKLDANEQLKAWKESAMQVMNDLDLQAIGKALKLSLGAPIAKQVLPGIQALQDENNKLKSALEKYEGVSGVKWKQSFEDLGKSLDAEREKIFKAAGIKPKP